MLLVRKHHQGDTGHSSDAETVDASSPLAQREPPADQPTTTALEQAGRDLHREGHSQRLIARDPDLDRRKVKQIIDRNAA
jgi:hypothetical protein